MASKLDRVATITFTALAAYWLGAGAIFTVAPWFFKGFHPLVPLLPVSLDMGIEPLYLLFFGAGMATRV